ncbi:hypothetical protein MIR68_011752 [Amoeboaphelidium protococcarum]|nr:hypothetical protein MIR68_011752 [Amoeboaphelidium protococcarum]
MKYYDLIQLAESCLHYGKHVEACYLYKIFIDNAVANEDLVTYVNAYLRFLELISNYVVEPSSMVLEYICQLEMLIKKSAQSADTFYTLQMEVNKFKLQFFYQNGDTKLLKQNCKEVMKQAQSKQDQQIINLCKQYMKDVFDIEDKIYSLIAQCISVMNDVKSFKSVVQEVQSLIADYDGTLLNGNFSWMSVAALNASVSLMSCIAFNNDDIGAEGLKLLEESVCQSQQDLSTMRAIKSRLVLSIYLVQVRQRRLADAQDSLNLIYSECEQQMVTLCEALWLQSNAKFQESGDAFQIVSKDNAVGEGLRAFIEHQVQVLSVDKQEVTNDTNSLPLVDGAKFYFDEQYHKAKQCLLQSVKSSCKQEQALSLMILSQIYRVTHPAKANKIAEQSIKIAQSIGDGFIVRHLKEMAQYAGSE